MKQIFNIIKFEFLRYFNTPTAFVFLITFLLLNGSAAFYLGYFLERGIADLNPMFAFMPWLFLLFIPAVSMRLFSEEYKSNTIYQTLSLPISITNLTIGKFFAAWAFTTLGIVLTFEFWITLNIIASPDNSTILNAYISSILLSGALTAIALFASSITKNQVIALILGIFIILLFFLSGVDFVLGFYKLFLSTHTVDILAGFSLLTHYSLMISGLVEIKAILYIISIIILFNFLTIISINAKFSNKSNYKILAIISFLGFIGFNLISTQSINFIDATQDKKHSLTTSTKTILQNLEEPIIAKLYYSEILSQKNPDFAELFSSVKTILKQYQKLSNNKFILEIYNPKTLTQTEDFAIANGLKGLPILDSNQNAFFGLILTDAVNNKEVVELFTPNKRNILESLITQKIFLLNHKKQNIGIITGLDMFETVVGGVATQNWQIIKELSSFYNIKKIDNANPAITDIQALLIISPKKLSPDLIKNIKEYKNNGGKFLILLDPAPEAFKNFAPQTSIIKASDINQLDKDFGFKFINNFFAADLDNSLTVDVTIDYDQNQIITQDVAQILLKKENINQAQNPTHGLKQILLSSASVIVPTNSKDISFIPLLTTSDNSGLMDINYIYQNTNPATILANYKKDDFQKFLAAKIIERNNPNPFKAIVVADSDFIYDNFLNSTDNLYFILNAIDELIGSHQLISLRSKSNSINRLQTIEKLRKASQLEFALKETQLLNELSQTKMTLNELIGKKTFENRDAFIADELAIIAKLRKNLSELKEKIGTLKENSYKKLDTIKNTIIFINIYLLPLLMLLLLLYKNRSSIIINKFSKTPLDKKSTYFSIACTFLFIIGIILNISNSKTENNKNVFPDIDISKINQITISKDDKTVDIYKDNDNWQIKGHKNFTVYQSRIKSLLSAISVATYYEKKSEKVKNLPYFDLDDKNATQIKLYTAQGLEENFFIGSYDIDLGRGVRGAFFRKENNLDVWLIKADLIDISPNWQEFCYSTLWNLRFGQAIGIKAEFIRDLINTPLLSALKELKSPTKEFELTINTNIKPITIEFFQDDNKYFIKYNFNTFYYNISKKDFDIIQKQKQARQPASETNNKNHLGLQPQ